MQDRPNASPSEPAKAPLHGFRLLLETEPWITTFLHNVRDLFHREPPRIWMTSNPGEYWADALVHRPVAWSRLLQSVLAHVVAVACVYAGNLYWLNQPHVITEAPPRNAPIVSYQLSEYLPAMKAQADRQETPVREKAQKADPGYALQHIVTLNADHDSRRQTIIQPDLKLLQQDTPLPNLAAWTSVPIPPSASRHSFRALPSDRPEVMPPAQPLAEHDVRRLMFPEPPLQVVAPASPVAANSTAARILAMAGPVVIPPTAAIARHDPSALTLAAQAPPLAAPPSAAVARSNFAVLTPIDRPDVVPPPQATIQHNLGVLPAPGSGQRPAVPPPAPPIAGGPGSPQAQQGGQLLVLNVNPLPPDRPFSPPPGSRKGEFAVGPQGAPGASGAPQARKGNSVAAGGPSAGSSPAGVFVDPGPGDIAGGESVPKTGARRPATAALTPDTESRDTPSDRIDNEVFGSRRRYSMHLNMPNLNSRMGSWTVRFAELNADLAPHGNDSDLTAPEAIRKVDPAYPANLIREQIEGVVVLHAVIHSDGSVGDVRVLEGFYEPLDENARAALEQWRFVPGTKNGIPVDVEAVIRVPFRVSRLGF